MPDALDRADVANTNDEALDEAAEILNRFGRDGEALRDEVAHQRDARVPNDRTE